MFRGYLTETAQKLFSATALRLGGSASGTPPAFARLQVAIDDASRLFIITRFGERLEEKILRRFLPQKRYSLQPAC
jgi:hypothetical protein